MEDEELIDRRNAELEFVSAAYSEEEAWYDHKDELKVFRRLLSSKEANGIIYTASFLIDLRLPERYPLEGCLEICCIVEEDRTRATSSGSNSQLMKAAYNALPDLLQVCRQAAESMPGEEAVLSVFNEADEWLQEQWPSQLNQVINSESPTAQSLSKSSSASDKVVLGRNLIYSHHIIGKQKRADMLALSSELQLSGFMKIGWPGIIIIEGSEESCHAFYDTIRRWAWQYLVLRGEMREEIKNRPCDNAATLIDSKRLFPKFAEVDDMSLVASHCRNVGLESLFLTSMKRYDEKNGISSTKANDEEDRIYGALIHVDHMNDGKSYRKWLRNICQEQGVSLILKQCYPNHDFNKKPIILVALIASSESVSNVLKRWRTSRVDVDSRGKPCLERMMSVLIEGSLDNMKFPTIDNVDDWNSEGNLNTTKEKLNDLLDSIGGKDWSDVVTSIW